MKNQNHLIKNINNNYYKYKSNQMIGLRINQNQKYQRLWNQSKMKKITIAFNQNNT